jgi:hypothetical protein
MNFSKPIFMAIVQVMAQPAHTSPWCVMDDCVPLPIYIVYCTITTLSTSTYRKKIVFKNHWNCDENLPAISVTNYFWKL